MIVEPADESTQTKLEVNQSRIQAQVSRTYVEHEDIPLMEYLRFTNLSIYNASLPPI